MSGLFGFFIIMELIRLAGGATNFHAFWLVHLICHHAQQLAQAFFLMSRPIVPQCVSLCAGSLFSMQRFLACFTKAVRRTISLSQFDTFMLLRIKVPVVGGASDGGADFF